MVVPLIIAGQAILHGLRIAGLRIIPYIIRRKTLKAAAQYATKKVGQKSITETGYVIVTKDPTKFRLAQKIFGKNKVFRSDKILQAQSTAEKEIIPLSQKILKSASPEVRTTILKQADDAANGVSKFISSSKVQTVGGTKITKPFTEFFGKNLKFSKETTELIKIAERGPLSISKDVAKIIPKPGTTIGKPKTILKTTKDTVKPAPKINKKLPVNVETITPKRPWYVNIMPKYLRTKKDVMVEPYKRVVTEGVAKGRLASTVGGGYGLYEGGKYIASNIDDTDKITRSGIDLNDSDLFETASQEYGQEEIASGINIYDTDEPEYYVLSQ